MLSQPITLQPCNYCEAGLAPVNLSSCTITLNQCNWPRWHIVKLNWPLYPQRMFLLKNEENSDNVVDDLIKFINSY